LGTYWPPSGQFQMATDTRPRRRQRPLAAAPAGGAAGSSGPRV